MLVFGENQPLHVKFLALKKNFWLLFFSAAKVVIIQGYALIQQLLHSRPAASFLEGFKWEFVGGWFLRLKKMEVNETFCFVTFRPINFGTISFPIKYFPKKIHLSFGWVPYRSNIRLQNTRIYIQRPPLNFNSTNAFISHHFTASQPTIIVQRNTYPLNHWTINDSGESTSQHIWSFWFRNIDFTLELSPW